jgi:MFS family permease
MSGLTEPFMIPYALALGANALQSGLLSSARALLVSLVQLWSADAVARLGSRKAVVLWTVGLQTVLWVPIAGVYWLAGPWAVAALILLYTLSTASVGLGGPAWGSLVADYVKDTERGAFFGRRARIVGFWTSVASLAAGGILHAAGNRPLWGFAALCLLAAAARTLSILRLRDLEEEPWRETPHLRFSIWRFLRQLPRSNFARFSCCLAFVSFGTHLAAPYFVVYQLQALGLSYLTYTMIALAGSVTALATSPWWGRIGDHYGNQAVLRWTMTLVAALPVFWTLVPHPVALAVWNALGAFLWSGLNLAATNFLYDAVSKPKRHTCLAYFNVLNGIGVAAGPIVGGWIMSAGESASDFAVVFYCSAALRLIGAFLFRRFVREVREVRQIGLREVMLDLAEEHLGQVLGMFSVAPERELGKRRRRRRAS